MNQFTPDTTDPELENFDLNLNSGVLTLYFSETVNVQSLDVRHIAIQSANDTSDVSVSLRDSRSLSQNLPIIDITLSDNDLNNIKADSMLAVSNTTTYLTIIPLAIQDMAGRQVIANLLNQCSSGSDIYSRHNWT